MALAQVAQADSADLVVTEIQSDSVNTSTGGDYWELTNNGTTSVDLSNWKWNDSARVNTGAAVTIPSGTTIAAGESIIFTGVTAANFRTWWGLSGSVQVISGASVPGLGSSDGISLFTNAGTEVLYLSYGASGFTRSNGTAAAGGHAGVSAGGAAKSALILDSSFATISSRRRYAPATSVGTFGAFASVSPTGDIGSPGVSGLPKSVDLSTYVRVGRYDLPEPTRTTPPNSVSLLAQEASGVAYNWDTDTLFITADGGTSIVQVTKTGALVDSMTLAPGSSPQGTDFYDPEGITYAGNGKFVMSEERDRQLVLFTYAAGTTLSRSGAKTVKIGTFVSNTGTEGLSFDPQTGGYICLKEIDPMGIFQTNVDFDAGTATNGSPSMVNSIDLFNPALAGMLDFADVFALSNVPSLSGTANSGDLLLLSQESAKIVKISRTGAISSSLTIVSDAGNPLNAAAQQHEGLTMDRNGILYVVSENGGGDFDHPQLWVYAPSSVPNQAPTAVALSNKVNSIAENTNTATRVKVADITVTDDSLGTNVLTVTGTDASFFEVVAGALYIKAGTVLDYETKTSYSITVNVDDSTVGSTPDATAAYALTVTDVVNETPVLPNLIISEVAPWSSGNSPVGADWFEVTNTGTTAVDITGWKVDDSSAAFGSALALNGITSIAAGESVIFMETSDLAGLSATFKSNWFGANPPAGLQIGSYNGSGIGLSTGGDAVNLYNASGVLQASVTFGASPAGPSYPTFNNAAGLTSTTISTLSVVGVNGAAAAVNSTSEVGSPGTVGKVFVSEVAPWSSGNSPVGADWFEVTNTTAFAVDITGWKVDDSSESFAAALALNGITSIASGESVIFMETADLATTGATFRSNWFGTNPPGGLKIGNYTGGGIGLSTGGDAVVLYNASGVIQAKVTFGASPAGPSFPTFDNTGGLNNTAISQLSAVGVNGALTAVNDAAEIGSPGAVRNAVNTAPTVANAIADQAVQVPQAFNFTFAANTFAEADSGQTLAYTATKGDNSALPAWLSFNGATRTFTGTPAASDAGTVAVKVTATDNGTPNLSVSATFSLVVTYVPPTFSFASAAASVREDANKVTLTINRGGDLSAASINVSTANGSGTAGTDYTALSASPVSFTLNQTTKTVDIPVNNRAGVRSARTFTATLASPGAPVVTTSPATATVTITEADSFASMAGPSSSTTPYMQPLAGNWQTTSLLTVGDAPALTGTTTGQTYPMVGIPDGLGAFDNGNNTITVLMNHELGNTLGAVRAHGAVGAFVSEWIINKSTLQVISGSDLIRNVYDWNTGTQLSNTTTSTVAFNRFCSADLPEVSAFYNAATGLGTQERIYMNGDESGANGYAVAHVVTGASRRNSYVLGKFNLTTNGSGLTGVGGWENVMASPYAQDKTVVVGANDGGTGIMTNSVSVYVGTKTSAGTEADKAGLTNGTQKFVLVTGNPVEITNTTTRTTGITSGTAFTLSGTASTTFSRPEDGAWDTVNPNRFYFVTTDRLDQVADDVGAQIGRTRLWRLNFADITNPDLGGTIDLLVTGGVGNDANMWDNMTVTSDGKLMIQEDVGGAAHNGKVWFYDPVTNSLTKVLKHDIARFGNVVAGVTTAATSPFTNDEEGSGIIEVTAMFGGNSTTGDRYFLSSVQAHYPQPGALIEGGQLTLIHQIASTTGISSSSSPYMLPVDSAWKTTSVLTVGDAPALTGTTTGQTYPMVGIPDGLGAFDNGNDTMTVLMNHELGNTLGAVRAHGAVGAFVSEWIINKSTLQVVSGSDLIRNVYDWNTGTQLSNTTTSTIAFNRFCSADLPEVSAFYNVATGLGTQERIYMNGDESGSNGYAVAHVATGASKGNSYVLGKFNLTTNGSGLTGVGGWENVMASPYAQDKTVVIGTNDGGTGIMTNSVSVYVGTKTSAGTEADKAGLTNGTQKFVLVTGNPVEITNTTTRTTGITSGTAFTLSGTASTTFSRPEDGAWDPSNPNHFYFVTTDRLDQVADGLGSQIGRTRLWRLNFADITNPDLGGTIDLLVTGGVGNDANMWDNMTVTTDGKLMIQEDVGGAAHNGKVWFYDPVTTILTKVIQHDPTRFGEVVGGVTTAAVSPFTNDEEGSGIIEVTALLGGNPAAGERFFLTSVQAHFPQPGALIEGGQLVVLRQSPKIAFSLAVAAENVSEDAGSVTLTVNRFGDLQYAATANVSTTDGTALAGTDYTALNNVPVNFAPGQTSKTVNVAIANRHGAAPSRSFTATLSGVALGSPSSTTVTIAPASMIAFGAAVYAVDQGATTVALTVNRSGGTDPVSVTINTNDGTSSTVPPFAAALAGTDYTDLAGASTTVEFALNETSKTVNVTLIPKTSTSTPNKRFTATLSAPSESATLGTISTAMIQIMATDTVIPSLTVTAPIAGTTAAPTPTISTPSPYQVKGIAGDAKGLDRVEVVLNGAAPVNAVLASSTVNTSVPYSLDIEPLPGLNTVTVTAFDLQGNTKAITRSFNFVRRYVLSIGRSVPVGIAVDAAGTVAMTASPTTAASALAPTTVNSNPKTSTIVPGTTVKLTATPKTGYVFSHWAGTPAGAAALGSVVSFTMPAEDVSTVTAAFVANPFFAPAGSSNTYYGLIHPQGAAPSNNSTEGFFTGTLTPTNGLFNGKVLIDGVSQSFLLYFYGNGTGLFNVGTSKQYTLTFGGRELSFYFDAGNITAEVTNGANVSAGTATRAIYSATNKVPAELLNQKVPATVPANNKGFFTIGFLSKAQDPVMDVSTYPQGDGFGTITITDVGVVSLSGTLADGTLVTGSSGLLAGNTCPIFVQMTTPGAAAAVKGGSFSGVLTFDTTETETDVSGSDLVWFRPAVTALTTPAAAAAATNLYTVGWPNSIRVDAAGALYDKSLTVQAGLGLDTPNPATGNAQLMFTDGKLTAPVTKTEFNVSANTVTKIPAANATFTLAFVEATGGLSGTFTPNWALPNTTKPGFKGILIQKGANNGGFGFFISNAKNDLDPESGGVTLSKQP